MDPLGSVTVLHSFGNPEDPSEGLGPSGTLIEASDGYLYGTTVNGGMNFGGTVFRMAGSRWIPVWNRTEQPHLSNRCVRRGDRCAHVWRFAR